jgi:hypothetical protein
VTRRLFARLRTRSLTGFVVWLPMLAADSPAAAGAASRTFRDDRVRHGWDADRALGAAFARTLGLSVTAWDVYLVYAAGAVWTGDDPPAPDFWMHQLDAASGAHPDRWLDAHALARETARLLRPAP